MYTFHSDVNSFSYLHIDSDNKLLITYSMCQFGAPGGSSLLKLLVTDLWTLLWTILFMRLTRLNNRLLSTKICSVLDVKSRLSRQHILSQLETMVQYSTHTMYRHLCQDEVQL